MVGEDREVDETETVWRRFKLVSDSSLIMEPVGLAKQ